jgi:hypothetical protein
MFVRRTRMHLKPHVENELRIAYQNEITPILRDQKGFLEELVLATPGKKEAIAITLWEEKTFADAFHDRAYSEVEKIMKKFVKGTPVVEDLTVEYTTYRKMHVAPAFV